jgi:hypothetical protein
MVGVSGREMHLTLFHDTSFDHAKFSIEESGENDETGEDDKAVFRDFLSPTGCVA